MTTPRLLVFQHIAIEHPGVFRDLLAERGVSWRAVELDEGEPIPELSDFDALWVMGGPMDVWQETEHPWLVAEKAAIRAAVVERRMPYFGFCLGHQLLAEALGGEVGRAATPEVGILEVELTAAGRAHPVFAGLPARGRCLQWHSAEVLRAPPGATVLASSPACAVQALAVGDTVVSVQYHVELTARTVPEWGEVPEYAEALEKTLGPGSLARMRTQADAAMPEFNAAARLLFENWMGVVAGCPRQPPPNRRVAATGD